VSGVRLFRLRRIGSPHAMPHTRNSGYLSGGTRLDDRSS
jgi:hypothetical protein